MKAICASVNLDLFMVLPRPTARIAHAAKLEFSSKDRSENREAGHGRCASVAGGAGRRSAAGHAANAGTNTSGAGGLYPIEAWGLIVLYNKAWERPQYRVSGAAVSVASMVRAADRHS